MRFAVFIALFALSTGLPLHKTHGLA
jgi:glutaredoxin 3